MQLELSTEERTFQRQTRDFISRFRSEDEVAPPNESLLREWKTALIVAGWQAYKWPREFGGAGWSATCKYLWERECGRVALPPDIGGMGIHMIGPILCGYGTREQQARYLPGILDGSTWWCQEEMQQYQIARSASIAGGSDEVQGNIMAKQVLGL